jgi:cyclopropane fatty-acyl-phospholipid synthase-like methyltransferase
VALTVGQRAAWVVDRLEIRPSDRLLEIGCGNGTVLDLVARRLRGGHVTGVDRYSVAIRLATARNAAHVAAGRVTLLQSEMSDLELGRSRFDTIFGVNVSAFWTAPERAALPLLRRHLRARGRLMVFVHTATEQRTAHVADAIGDVLKANDFTPEIEHERHATAACVVARPAE